MFNKQTAQFAWAFQNVHMYNAQYRNMLMHPIKCNLYISTSSYVRILRRIVWSSTWILVCLSLVTSWHIFPMIQIERLVDTSLRCSQDTLERVKLTTWRGLSSWADNSMRPLSRGGWRKKCQNFNKIIWDVLAYNVRLTWMFETNSCKWKHLPNKYLLPTEWCAGCINVFAPHHPHQCVREFRAPFNQCVHDLVSP
jgi:hypothetical protein